MKNRIVLVLIFSSFAMGLRAQCDSLKDVTIHVTGTPVLSDYRRIQNNLLTERFRFNLLEIYSVEFIAHFQPFYWNNGMNNCAPPTVKIIAPFAGDTVYGTKPLEINAIVKTNTIHSIVPPVLKWTITDSRGTTSDSVFMTMVSGDSLWEATIPWILAGKEVTYFVTGSDLAGNTASDSSHYATPRGYRLNTDYIDSIITLTGIDLYALIESTFFMDYMNYIDSINAYFSQNVRNNPALRAEFDYWMQEFIQAPICEEDSVITAEHHQYYIAAENLSRIYFGDSACQPIVFDGVTYMTARGKIESIAEDNAYGIFEQNMMASFSQYVNLSKELQDKVIRIAIIISPFKEDNLCYGPCQDEYDKGVEAAYATRDIATEECAKIKNEKKKQKCYNGTAATLSKELIMLKDEFCECMLFDRHACAEYWNNQLNPR